MPRVWLFLALVLAGLLPAGGALAEDHDEQDEARGAVRAGAIQSLDAILAKIRISHPGEIVRVHLERERGGWIYELRQVDPTGRVRELHVDAVTGTVIEKDRD